MKPQSTILRVLFILSLLLLTASPSAAQEQAPYLNPQLPVEQRVDDLLARMTLGEKIGQMTLVEKNSISAAEITNFGIGGVLSAGGGYPQPNTPKAWAAMVDGFQDGALGSVDVLT